MEQTQAVHPSVSKTPIPLDATDLATVCVLCSHNCGIRVDVTGGRITDIRADERNPITEGYICNKAVTVDRYAHHGQRTQQPLRRRTDGTFEPVTWDAAIDDIAARLRRIRDEHGPRAIGLVGIGGQANHMDAPYASSFLRAIGSRRWFNAYAQEKTQHHLVDQWMFDAAPSVFFHPDLEHVGYLIVMGTNPRISNRGHNPNETFKELAKRPGCVVVAVDPREDRDDARRAEASARPAGRGTSTSCSAWPPPWSRTSCTTPRSGRAHCRLQRASRRARARGRRRDGTARGADARASLRDGDRPGGARRRRIMFDLASSRRRSPPSSPI
jgi:anaerobic selenocysteine-containing dehydrogenase